MNMTRSLYPALFVSAALFALPAGAEQASDTTPRASPAAGKFTVVPAKPGSDEEMILEGLTNSLMLLDAMEGDLRIEVAAPVEAVRQGDVVEVVFKDLRMIDDEANGISFGDLTYRFSPDGDGVYRYGIQMADTWSLLDAGQPKARVVLGRHECKGRMARQLRSDVECSLGGITLQGSGGEPLPEGVVFSVDGARLGLTQKREPQGGVLKGGFQVAVDGTRLDSGDGSRVEIRTLTMESSVDGAPFAAWERFFQRLAGLKGKAIESLPDDEAAALSMEALPLLNGAIIKSNVHIGGLKVAQAGTPLLNLDKASLLTLYDASRNLTDIRYGIAMEGLSLGLAEVPLELQPMAASLDLTLSGLPLRGLFDGLVALAPLRSEGDPRLDQLLMEQMVNKPPVLVINEVRAGGGGFDLRMNGNLETRFATLTELAMAMEAETDPAKYLSGSMHAKIKGMDFLTALAVRHAGDNPDVGEILLAASVVKGFGKPTGEDTFDYDLHIDPEGNLIINETNFGKLMETLAADSTAEGQEKLSATSKRDFMGDCMGFVGNEGMCKCLQTQVPQILTFKDYMQLVINPERFPFDVLGVETTPEQRQFITEQAMRARDACK